jgi:hypothetical protein
MQKELFIQKHSIIHRLTPQEQYLIKGGGATLPSTCKCGDEKRRTVKIKRLVVNGAKTEILVLSEQVADDMTVVDTMIPEKVPIGSVVGMV